MKPIQGSVWKVGDNIDTDVILASKYLTTSDPKTLGAHCLESVIPEIAVKINQGDILVAGKNFGCGSSREHAPMAILYAGFSCVIAESFARIFYRNAINIGLPIFVVPGLSKLVEEGEALTVNVTTGEIRSQRTENTYHFEPFPPFLIDILNQGGIIAKLKNEKATGNKQQQ